MKMAEKVIFIITSILLGVGLAMDAFSVSLANGMQEPSMKRGKMCGIAGVFAGFQALMPMIGWLCVHTVAQKFKAFEKLIPWIALGLLAYIGGTMLYHGIRGGEESEEVRKTGFAALLMQGIATSIDALSVGFTIADYGWLKALLCAAIIAAVTFVICFAGLLLGRKIGTKIGGKAEILGGIILIGIGIEIFVSHMFF
jgi:putative Mn2+ efflux pump MntP